VGNLTLRLGTDLFYKSDYNYTQLLRPGYIQGGNGLLDVSASLLQHDGPWQLSLIGRNVTDRHYIVFAQEKPGGNTGDLNGSIGDPREVVLQARYKF
jgi:iron complex outermembrane receptor protein